MAPTLKGIGRAVDGMGAALEVKYLLILRRIYERRCYLSIAGLSLALGLNPPLHTIAVSR